jgi:hypothetical protein
MHFFERFFGEIPPPQNFRLGTSVGKTGLYLYLQGVSEFDRQTFRTDSTIKNMHKTLNTDGVKKRLVCEIINKNVKTITI